MLAEYLNQYRKYLPTLWAGFGSLLLFLVLFNYTFVSVDLDQPKTAGADITITKNSPTSQASKSLRFGLNIVKKGDSKVDLKTQDKATTVYKNMGLLRINHVAMSLEPQKSIDKLFSGSGDSTCGFKDATTSTVAYACKTDGIFKQTGISAPLETPTVPTVGSPQPYKNGVLAFTKSAPLNEDSDRVSLAYIDSSNPKTVLANADEYIDEYDGTIVTTANSESFVVVNKTKQKFYYFLNTAAKPVTYSYKEDTNNALARMIIPSLASSGTDFYISYSTTKPSKEDTTSTEDTGPTNLTHYRIDKNSVEKVENIDLEKVVKDKSVKVVSTSLVYSLDISSQTLTVIDLSSKKPKELFTAYGVLDATAIENSLYYVNTQEIHRYDTASHTAYLVRKTGSNNISALNRYGTSLTFSGNSVNALSTSSIYRVKNADKPKSEPYDTIPYNLNDLPILKSDFKGNSLYFWIDLNSLTYGSETGDKTYDTTEYELRKEMVIRRLKEDGLDPEKYLVTFSPGP